MSAKRKATTVRKPDSINPEHDSEASAERKVLYVWTSFDQMYGKRWAENFGNDPLGKVDAANRMTMWLDALKFMSWPNVKQAVNKIRTSPKPSEWWLPDLQSFTQFSGRGEMLLTIAQEKQLPDLPWFATYANRRFLSFLFSKANTHRGTASACVPALIEAKNRIVAAYIEIEKEDKTVSLADIHKELLKAWRKVWVEVSEEEVQADASFFAIHKRLPFHDKKVETNEVGANA